LPIIFIFTISRFLDKNDFCITVTNFAPFVVFLSVEDVLLRERAIILLNCSFANEPCKIRALKRGGEMTQLYKYTYASTIHVYLKAIILRGSVQKNPAKLGLLNVLVR